MNNGVGGGEGGGGGHKERLAREQALRGQQRKEACSM